MTNADDLFINLDKIRIERETRRFNHEKNWIADPVNITNDNEGWEEGTTPSGEGVQEFIDKFPGVRIYSAGGIVPFEAYGIIMGYPFYLRSRGGITRLSVNDPYFIQHPEEMSVDNTSVTVFLSTDTLWSAERESEIDSRSFAQDFELLINDLSRHPFLYEFPTVEVDWRKMEEYRKSHPDDDRYLDHLEPLQPLVPTTRSSWGYHPEEAYHRIIADTALLHAVDRKHASPMPVTQDNRKIGNMPDFPSLIHQEWENRVI